MLKKSNALKSGILPSVFLVLTVISAILFRASRSNWVFINLTLGIESFTVILLTLMILTAVLLGILSALNLYGVKLNDKPFCETKTYKALLGAGVLLTVIFTVFSLIYSCGLFFGENREVFSLNLQKTIKEGALLIFIPFFAVFFPILGKKAKKVTAVAFFAFTILFGVNILFPLSGYDITSEPLVIDNGKEYSIVFSTSDRGTAYVEYSYNGKEYKVVDGIGGRMRSESKIHNISVPYEHLRNNSYKIGSTRVTEEFSYGSRLGKSVVSEEYKFIYNDSDNQTFLVISDWHTFLDRAYKAIDHLGNDYDAVILLGDATPGVDFEQQVISNIVQFGGKVSGGTKPVIYVRGNHETRGSYADELPTALGLEQLYYIADFGPYSFVVLDSGEDKDDSHPEYGGMNDYNTYRADMIEWLKEVEVKNEKVIALSHSWEISDVEEELSEAGWAELDRLGTRLIMSGHTHQCRFIGDNEGKEKETFSKYPDIIGYMDGGKSGDNYVASMLTLTSEGFTLKAADMNGEKVIEESFVW